MWTRRTYGRAPMGQRVNRAVGTQRGGNTTVIAAISDQVGIFYHELHFGPVNGEIFNHFMAGLEAIFGDYPVVFIWITSRFRNVSYYAIQVSAALFTVLN